MDSLPDEHLVPPIGSPDNIHWFANGRPRPGSAALCGHTATAESIALVRQGSGLGPDRFCPLCDRLARVLRELDR